MTNANKPQNPGNKPETPPGQDPGFVPPGHDPGHVPPGQQPKPNQDLPKPQPHPDQTLPGDLETDDEDDDSPASGQE